MFKKLLPAVLFIFTASFCAASPAAAPVPPVIDLSNTEKAVVVIDPAHGGPDTGVSFHGAVEKDIDLRLAKLIKQKIERSDKDIVVYLTRNSDSYLSPADRAGFANSKKAFVFVSIHCDYAVSQKAGGLKVYYQTGKDAGEKKPGQDVIDWENVQAHHINDSIKLAGYISQYMQTSLISDSSSKTGADANDSSPVAHRKDKAVDHNSLTGADMPAVVVEIGNLNNRDDFSNVKNDKALSKIAYHIKEGIVRYIRENKIRQ
jgi:N-acetylmuramoyl-L-alanine amidase